jgi:ATP-dependent DNA helicase RecQ
MTDPPQPAALAERIHDVLRQTWGFEQLRPHQDRAIRAVLDRRDSLVVLPTGGGKSLCYQVPPLLLHETHVVVSPLIALMKDQVDGLQQLGYPAAALHSGLSPAEQADVDRRARAGELRLIFVAPERLLKRDFLDMLRGIDVRAFAIDEAHCISHWGHDFRQEYRRLTTLKERFPHATVHAYTATATPRVCDDIAAQLKLRDPATLIGNFDRPNLVYRVVPRVDVRGQAQEVIERHRDQAVIVYCITRRETEELANWLRAGGYRAAYYHAGMDADARRATQDAFARESLDVIVATVAFGMGIDRSDVRCVLHTAMPKSVEHYQQEAGRAGRDGLAAECVMLYSPADHFRWESLIRKSADNAQRPAEVTAAGLELLHHVRALAARPVCRHRMLVEYFGQSLEHEDCGACDVCLGEIEGTEDGTQLAQKVLSCVARVEQRFGVGHVVKVLTGANDQQVRRFGHDQLSTYNLLPDVPQAALTNVIHQLVDMGVLDRTASDRPLLKLNAASWEVLRGERSVRVVMPKQRAVRTAKADAKGWDGVDRTLFERLRALRREIAQERKVPAYIVFQDATLRDMARKLPQTEADLLHVHAVGQHKLKSYGSRFLAAIRAYAAERRPPD